MNIPVISGSAQTYARNLLRQAKAMQRVENGVSPASQKQQQDKTMIEAMLDPDRGSNISVASITSKLDRGKKLSPKEMDFLKRHAPELYKKAKEVAQEREQFEQELKRCKTKDDVQRLRLRYSQKISQEMTIAMKNGGDVKKAEWKFLAVNDSHQSFVQSKEFKELPTEQELLKDKDRQKERKAKKAAKKNTLLQKMQEHWQTPGFGSLQAEQEPSRREERPDTTESEAASSKNTAAVAAADASASGQEAAAPNSLTGPSHTPFTHTGVFAAASPAGFATRA